MASGCASPANSACSASNHAYSGGAYSSIDGLQQRGRMGPSTINPELVPARVLSHELAVDDIQIALESSRLRSIRFFLDHRGQNRL